mmetsp:Transcript_3011/g.4554  ORF Transcript_3011/g.4554 Transcript_3011/m.4554 type:complete len:92 (+) Transcript_3011:3-278(+)
MTAYTIKPQSCFGDPLPVLTIDNNSKPVTPLILAVNKDQQLEQKCRVTKKELPATKWHQKMLRRKLEDDIRNTGPCLFMSSCSFKNNTDIA